LDRKALYRLSNERISRLIDNYVRRSDYRRILKDRMINGLTYNQIANIYGFSEKQVKNIVYKNENALLKILDIKVP
jgi:DNA-directed RNA polymerase specialized sigma24 family protein